MGFFYVDESIHERGDFIIAAIIYSEVDLNPAVFDAIREVGLTPGVDEFKSSATMSTTPEQVALRKALKQLFFFRGVRIGIVILPLSRRAELGREVLKGLTLIITANGLDQASHQIFVDNEIGFDPAEVHAFRSRVCQNCKLHSGQDSVKIGGIQLADLAAHCLAILLLEEIGLVTKDVRVGENSGYLPDMRVSLGFEIWAALRYAVFMSPRPTGKSGDEGIDFRTYDVQGYGLHIADSCDSALRDAALKRFGSFYLGCIH